MAVPMFHPAGKPHDARNHAGIMIDLIAASCAPCRRSRSR